MTLHDLIAEANQQGLLVNDLFQLSTGGWQANLRNAAGGFAHGFGDTPEQALWRALERAREVLDEKPAVAAAPAHGGLFD